MNLSVFNLFCPKQIVCLGLYAFCIVHEETSRNDRHFSRVVGALTNQVSSRGISFNIPLSFCWTV